ncbi:MAG TPA: hypothetical protein DEF51_45025 [Myxococcales bacterium]|nr:hypothetical protein [Myxococcales bacterium]
MVAGERSHALGETVTSSRARQQQLRVAPHPGRELGARGAAIDLEHVEQRVPGPEVVRQGHPTSGAQERGDARRGRRLTRVKYQKRVAWLQDADVQTRRGVHAQLTIAGDLHQP